MYAAAASKGMLQLETDTETVATRGLVYAAGYFERE